MSCRRVQNRLMLFQEGAVIAREAAEIRRHLRRCACCSAVAAEMLELERIAAFALSTSAPAPAGFDSRVMAAIRDGGTPAVRHLLPVPLTQRLRRLALAAILLIIATTAVAIGHWLAYRGVNDRMGALPPPSICATEAAIPSVHALPKINGRIVSPNSPELLKIGSPPTGVAGMGHTRKHGPLCRCWANISAPPPAPDSKAK